MSVVFFPCGSVLINSLGTFHSVALRILNKNLKSFLWLMHVWTAEKTQGQCLLQNQYPVQWGNFYTGSTAIQQENSGAGCLISDLALNFFTFRDPGVPPSCKNGQRDTKAVWSHHVRDAELSGVSDPGLGYSVGGWSEQKCEGREGETEERNEREEKQSCEHPLLCSITQAAATAEFFQDSSGHRDVELKHRHMSRWELWTNVLSVQCKCSSA